MRKSEQKNINAVEAATAPATRKAIKLPKLPKGTREKKKSEHQASPKPPRGPKPTFREIMRSRQVIGMVCLAAAVLLGFVLSPALQSWMARRVPVVVAAANITRGELLRPEHLSVSDVAAIDLPGNAAQSIEQVAGSFATLDMLKGDMLTSSKLSWERPMTNPYLYDLPDGKVAISITVKGLAEGLSGKLKAGDVVTVYAVFSRGGSEGSYVAIQPPELKYVRVLAVSGAMGQDIDIDVPSGKQSELLPASITLLADDVQAAALAGLDQSATIHLGLAARADSGERGLAMLEHQEAYMRELQGDSSALSPNEMQDDEKAVG